MEHLFTLSNVLDNCSVPCFCTEDAPYDGLGFSGFPVRRGYDLLELRRRHNQPPEQETSAMLQAWLFFGMLSEVMGTTINADDFRRKNDKGELVITTVLLDYHMHQWAARCKTSQIFREENRSRAIACLSEVSHYVHLPASTPIAQLICDEVSISIQLVGEALAHFGYSSIWQDETALQKDVLPQIPSFSRPGFAKSSSFEPHSKSWCPSDRRRLSAKWAASAIVFLSLISLPDPGLDHGRCKEDECQVYDVSNNDCGPMHVATCTGCEMMGPDEGKLQEMIRYGEIPLVKAFQLPNDKYKLDLVSAGDETQFAIISHDWSGELGCPEANKIPHCQLERIAQSLQKEPITTQSLLSVSRSATAAAAMEVMMSRRPSSCAEPQALSDRFEELSAMRKGAHENNLAERPKENIEEHKSSGKAQPPTRQTSSKGPGSSNIFWFDTLCIPQEPYHRKKAISELNRVYKAARRVLVLDSHISSVKSGENPPAILANLITSRWMRRLWVLPETLVAKRLQFILADNVLNFVPQELPQLPTCSDLLIQQLQSKVPFSKRKDLGGRDRMLQGILAGEIIAYKSLTKPEDEAVILGLLLDFHPRDMLQILNTPAEDRMRVFWSILKNVPSYVLFWNGPKIARSPYSWAPSTLRQRVSNSSEFLQQGDGTITEHGLQVHLFGWLFTMHNSPDDEIILWDKSSNAQYLVRRDNQTSWINGWIFKRTEEPQQYAIICQAPPTKEGISSHAVLARAVRREQDVVYTSFLRHLRVSKVGDTTHDGPFFPYFFKGSKMCPVPVIVPETLDKMPAWVIG